MLFYEATLILVKNKKQKTLRVHNRLGHAGLFTPRHQASLSLRLLRVFAINTHAVSKGEGDMMLTQTISSCRTWRVLTQSPVC